MQSYDVVIAGGGTAGCSAAYNLGKSGKKVLIIEKNIHLGGTMTSAFVSPMMNTSKNQINTDFLEAFIKRMKHYKGQITYIDGNIGWFNPELAKIALDDLMQETNVDILFNSKISNLDISNKYIEAIYTDNINNKEGEILSPPIVTRYVIDTTGNCDIGKIARCNFLENNLQQQPTSLRFIMSGINLEKFSSWLMDFDKDRNVTTCYKSGNEIHLSTAYTWDVSKQWALKPLFDEGVRDGIIKDEDRNYFQVFTIPGMTDAIGFNCPRIYFRDEINPLDAESASKALILGRQAIFRLSKFCIKYLKGFEKAYISNIADMLGVRVSRRIKGKYVYTVDDLKSGKKFENPVLISNYPIDVHSNKNNKSILDTNIGEYQLPVESLMSCDIENLFVAGRCLSADFYSQAALRIIPSCFSMGEGLAKYIIKKDVELISNKKLF